MVLKTNGVHLERMPTAKWLRALYRIESEMVTWEAQYRAAAVDSFPDRRSGKYEDREAVLGEAVHRIEHVIDTLQGMPRLS